MLTTNLFQMLSFLTGRKFFLNNYHPQRSYSKVMFLHLSVTLFTGGCPSLGGLCPGGLSGGSLSNGSLSGRPPWMVICGWYAFYWNAFLFT